MSFPTTSVTRRQRLAQGVALLGCALAAAPAAQAAIVNIDVSTFNAVNAGLSYGSDRVISNFVPGADLTLVFDSDYSGLDPLTYSMLFDFAVDGPYASPHNFAAGADISAWAGAWSNTNDRTLFRYYSVESPNFGAGSFIGFRFGSAGSWNYGWIEVTWNWTGNPQTSTFQILGAAYESTVNTAILAGALAPPAIPLPGAAGLAACGLLGLSRRRRR